MSKANKGSRKWIQVLVNDYPEILNNCIGSNDIQWVSPIAQDNYLEYKDGKVIEKLGITLENRKLHDFWPRRGQTWDALGKSSSGTVFLVEAKSHITEIDVGGTGAKAESSRLLISKSLREVQEYLNAKSEIDWSKYFYQYCNRLAYLYFLRELNSIDAYLVWVCFVNDKEMNGPTSAEKWLGAIKLMKHFLGTGRTKLDPYIKYCFIDVEKIKTNSGE